MIYMLIDGVEVSLSEDTILPISEENQLLTKSGTYTNDFELSILDKKNAKLYNHIRFDNNPIFTGRKVLIYKNSELMMSGREVITAKTNKTVTIQVVSGNSMFSDVFSDKVKIWEHTFIPTRGFTIDNGTFDYPVYSQMSQATGVLALNSTWLEYDGAPITHMIYPTELKDLALGSTFFAPGPVRNAYNANLTLSFGDAFPDKIFPQLYLATYLELLLKNKGLAYDLSGLHTNERALRAIVMNPLMTRGGFIPSYAWCLPDWTEQEFIVYCENFFRVTIYIDVKTGVVSVKNIDDTSDLNEGIERLSDFEITPVDPDNEEGNLSKPAYSLPDDDYFLYENLPDEFLENKNVKIFKYATYEHMRAEFISDIPDEGITTLEAACMHNNSSSQPKYIAYCEEWDLYFIPDLQSSVTTPYYTYHEVVLTDKFPSPPYTVIVKTYGTYANMVSSFVSDSGFTSLKALTEHNESTTTNIKYAAWITGGAFHWVPYTSSQTRNQYWFRPTNKFKAGDISNCDLPIIPAKMYTTAYYVYPGADSMWKKDRNQVLYAYPVCSHFKDKEGYDNEWYKYEHDESTLYDKLKRNNQPPKFNFLQVVINHGIRMLRSYDNPEDPSVDHYIAPIHYVDTYHTRNSSLWDDYGWYNADPYYMNEFTTSLRFNGPLNMIDQNKNCNLVDFSELYTCFFKYLPINVLKWTLIDNKLFIPKKIEYDVDSKCKNVKDELIKGTFYAIK